MTAAEKARKHYMPFYQDALISAAGYAQICGEKDAAQILLKLSADVLINKSKPKPNKKAAPE